MRIQDLFDKKIAIWGLGAEGASTFKTLRKKLPGITLTLLNDTPFNDENTAILHDPFTTVITGKENIREVLADFDVVIKSPGISLYRPEIKEAMAKGVFFTSATRLWFNEHKKDKTICITGTKGKSTTSTLITHLLRKAGYCVTLGGNIGTPMLDMLTVEPNPDFWVIEMSSYQISDLDSGPAIAVLVNLYPEHLDWHQGEENYFRDKLNLFANQDEQGIAILNKLDKNTALANVNWRNPVYFNDENGFHLADGYICEGQKKLLPTELVTIPGKHNLFNICAALTAVRAAGVDPERCLEAITSFKGLPHRLYPLGEKNGHFYVEDSISTTPQSAIAAVETYQDKKVTILLGGYDRGVDIEELAEYMVKKNVHGVVTMGTNGNKIATAIRKYRDLYAGSIVLNESNNLSEAIRLAVANTPTGGVILLSPGAPSYDHFKNYAERGNAFAQLSGFDIVKPL